MDWRIFFLILGGVVVAGLSVAVWCSLILASWADDAMDAEPFEPPYESLSQ